MTPFPIPDHWTPEQALAVYELVDEIRDAIWNKYQVPLIELMQEERVTTFEIEGDVTF